MGVRGFRDLRLRAESWEAGCAGAGVEFSNHRPPSVHKDIDIDTRAPGFGEGLGFRA